MPIKKTVDTHQPGLYVAQSLNGNQNLHIKASSRPQTTNKNENGETQPGHSMNDNLPVKKPIREAVNYVKEYLENNPFTNKDADVFAAEKNVGVNELRNGFKHIVGEGINDYQIFLVIKIACQKLLDGKSVKEVARDCGYNPSYFSQLFKQRKNMTPTEWREKNSDR